MGKPTKLYDVQKLAGRVAVLSRFVARLGEKALPFYALMKELDNKFEWTEEADIAFGQLKKSAFHTAGVGRTKGKRAIITLYCSNASCGEHSIRSQKK
jgi:hypothetical protein